MNLMTLLRGLYTIINDMGENSFELSIPLFLGLHSMFNVDLLQPYVPPLLDTSKVVKHFPPT
jgi:hypothetical protein